jgi:DHA1 family bicyclomycin/chloramphenicol resistance-like MFS transporter
MQGMSAGAGVVIGRAIIRDMYSDARATRLLSLVTMIFSIAPAIAPILGGWIVKFRNWRAIFLFLFLYTAFLIWFAFRKLPETLPVSDRRAFNPRNLATSYWRVFTSIVFQFKAGTVAFIFAGLFLYVAAAPVFLTQHLRLGPEQFGWQFVPMVGGIFLGALASNRIAGKVAISTHVGYGFALLTSAGVINLAYHTYFAPALPWSVLPLFLYAIGMSLVTPVVTLLVMDLFPDIRGLAASCQSFTQTMLAAVTAGVIAPLLWDDVVLLAAGQLVCAIMAAALWVAGAAVHQSRTRGSANAWESVPVE